MRLPGLPRPTSPVMTPIGMVLPDRFRRSTGCCSCARSSRPWLRRSTHPTSRWINGICSTSCVCAMASGYSTSWAAAAISRDTSKVMSARPAVALWLTAVLVYIPVQPAAAQADSHARALARASCLAGKQSERVTSATAALARDSDELEPRMRLADALVDQGCYQEAVGVLETAQKTHPRNSALT